jgi:uncharacterized membrane protein
MRFFRWRESLRTSLWLIPALCVATAAGLGLLLVEIDRNLDATIGFRGGPDSAHTFLSTISSSMITFTGLVFTITIVVLQLASQQFSPRVLRTFLRDRHSQFALGVFTATFAYALIILRAVRTEASAGGEFVPSLSVSVAFILVMLSLALFVDYIHHIAQSIRVPSITSSIAEETREAISDIYDHEHTDVPVPLPMGGRVVDLPAPKRGILTALDRDRLVSLAQREDCVVEVVPAIGDFVPEGSTLLRLHGKPAEPGAFVDQVGLGPERTMQQDPAFGFRQLVDIAERGLSPAVNDPTTAVQCVDEIHDLLRRLAVRAFPSGQRFDASGSLRLSFPVTSWDGYISLACDEIRQYGGGSIQIHRRLRSMLEDLMSVAPRERHAPLRRQLTLLDESADLNLDHASDRASAKESDEQGIGGT